MAYIKLSKETNTGKGFILPGDRKTLSFEGYGDIYKVTGDEKSIGDWAARVKGSIIADADALAFLKTAKLIALKNEIVETQNKLAELKAIKEALEAAQ